MKQFTAKKNAGFLPYLFHCFWVLLVLFVLAACSDEADTGSSNTSAMTYQFTDGCDDNRQIEYRLFDVSNDKVWPSSSEVYALTQYDRPFEKTIECSTGADICYGGVSRVLGILPLRSWGVGINNNDSCQNCCNKCEKITLSITLTC